MSKLRHIALAWGLLLAIVAAFASGLWLPLVDKLQENRTRIAELDNRIAKLASLALTRDDLKAQIAAADNAEDGDGADQYIAAKSTTLGTAELQRYLQETIVANGAKQSSSQALPGSATNGLHKLAVKVNFSGSLSSLQRILIGLEYGWPHIFVEQLLVSANTRSGLARARARRQSSALSVTPELSASLLVAAYMHLDQRSNDPAQN